MDGIICGRNGLETFTILVQEREALSKRECHQKSPRRYSTALEDSGTGGQGMGRNVLAHIGV